MTTALSFAKANLPAAASLAASLRSIQSDVGNGDVLLKMEKAGDWVYGADATEVEEGSQWAVNPFAFIHGYIAWGDGVVAGEIMTPMSQPLPEVGAVPPGAKSWQTQLGISLRCVSGDDEGQEVVYRVTSKGGKKAIQTLGAAIADKVEQEQDKGAAALIVPVITLGTDSYKHKEFGKIYTPVFNVVKWLTIEGTSEAVEAAPAAEDAPRRRRRG
jgi:hypothetical protein